MRLQIVLHRFAAIFAFAVFALLPSASVASDVWTKFNDPAGAFSVDIPQAFTVTRNSTTAADGFTTKMTQYLIDRGTSALLVMDAAYSRQPNDDASVIDTAVTATQAQTHAFEANEDDDLNGHLGRQLTFHKFDGTLVTVRMFVIGNHFYQFIAGGPKVPSREQNAVAQRYLSSLHLLR